MTNHTAEDFEQARFAERPDVLRHDAIWDAYSETWRLGSGETIDVQRLAAGGWVPVREANGGGQVTERTLEVAQSNAEKKRQKLLDHIASLEAIIRRRNDQIERLENQFEKADRQRSELAEQVDELRGACAPVSLDVLRAAYEQAEVPTGDNPACPGDVLIGLMFGGGYEVYEKASWGLIPGQRILSRAPREPWADLEEDLKVMPGIYGSDGEYIAQTLHDAGWRKTGGDET